MRHLSAAALLCLATGLSAQTYIVDASGGGNFTSLQQAVSAVPSGSVLRVRAGKYLAFTLQNKSLTIIGDSKAARVYPTFGAGPAIDLVLGPTAATHKVVLKNLTLAGVHDLAALRVIVSGVAGPLWLEDLELGESLSNAACVVTLTSCADAHWLRCTAQAAVTPTLAVVASALEMAFCVQVSAAAKPGIDVTSSVLTLVSTAVGGGSGGPFMGPGRPGIALAAGSRLHAYGTTSIRGGDGQLGVPGGNGIDASASEVFLVGVAPAGGNGTPPGAPVKADASSTVRALSATGPTLTLGGTPAPSAPISADLRANSGDVAALLIGQQPLYVPAPLWLTLGTLFVDPQATIGSFVLPASGQLSVPLQLPGGLMLNELFVLQYAVLPSGLSEVWMSNATSILVKS